MIRSSHTIAVPPAEVIGEYLVARGMTQKELAIRMGTSEKNICMLMQGKAPLTPETAENLEMVFDVPAESWLTLESLYRADLQKIKSEKQNEADVDFVSKIDYPTLASCGWVKKTKVIEERVLNLRKFFEVAHLSTLTNSKFTDSVAFRKLRNTDKSELLAFAWCQRARVEARNQKLGKLDIKRIKSKLDLLKQAVAVTTPNIKVAQGILNDCGVAVVILPQLKGSGLHGASFSIGKNVVLGMTDRRKTADIFSFSFFHELAHVIHGDFRRCELTDEDENKADRFAAELLISPEAYAVFVKNADYSKAAIMEFAKQESVDTGIVVGRLQKDGLINYNTHNDLKHQFQLFMGDK